MEAQLNLEGSYHNDLWSIIEYQDDPRNQFEIVLTKYNSSEAIDFLWYLHEHLQPSSLAEKAEGLCDSLLGYSEKEQGEYRIWLGKNLIILADIYNSIPNRIRTLKSSIPSLPAKATRRQKEFHIVLNKTFSPELQKDVIKLLYSKLIEHSYISVTEQEFENHFIPAPEFNRIEWHSSKVALVLIFSTLKSRKIILTNRLYVLIANHFTQEQSEISTGTLNASNSKSAYSTSREKPNVDDITQSLVQLVPK